MGNNIGQNVWPSCGEIDFLEMGMHDAIVEEIEEKAGDVSDALPEEAPKTIPFARSTGGGRSRTTPGRGRGRRPRRGGRRPPRGRRR